MPAVLRPFCIAACLCALCPRLPASPASAVPDGGTEERLAVELSFLSLAGFWHTEPARVREAVTGLMARMLPRQEVVWGPAVHHPGEESAVRIPAPSDALAFVSRDLDTGDYYVVFRGTNPISSAEWLFQDFAVLKQVPWREIQPGPAPADALVSEGTATAVALRRGLRPGPGVPGEGRSLAEELADIPARSDGSCVMHFTGHSLGGLLASTMALWLTDRLAIDGRGDLLSRLAVDVTSFAAPTAGNQAFAAYCAARVPAQRRYACPLDVVPRAWAEETMRDLPSLYEPDVPMQPLSRSFYELCWQVILGKGYAQPGAAVQVPSRVVPVRSDLYFLELVYQHAMPYLDLLPAERRDTILREVIGPINELVPVSGILPVDVRSLFLPDR